MPLTLADRVRDTTTTTGTGTVTLSGTAPTGYQDFSVIGNGNTTYYTINAGSQWEVGIGTYSSTGTTLSRDTILESSNGGAAVNFAAGTKDVFVTYPAEKSISDGYGLLPVANGGTGVTASTGTGSVVLNTSPTLVTPTLGAASATSITNGLGAVGTPSYTFTGDTNTGMWSPSSDAIAFSTAGSERVRITSAGNVGIGTTSPSAKLDVNGDFKAGNTVNIGLADTNPTIVNVGTGATGDKFAVLDFIGDTTYTDYGLRIGRLDDGANGTSGVQHRGTGALNLNCQDAGVIIFATSATERMRITSAGNVGIGTSAPVSLLHVDAPSNVGSFFTGSGNSNGVFPPAAFGLNIGYNFEAGVADVDFFNSWTSAAGGQGGFSFRRQTGASTQVSLMRISGSGNVGIGTSAPTALLDVNSDTVRVRTARTPASAAAAGNAGDVCWDSNYIYVCVATNTWKRTAIATW
jgi:hypothetical protein